MQATLTLATLLREPEPHAYTFPVEDLGPGCSLGNPLAFARLDACSNVVGLWGVEDEYYLGLWRVRLSAGGTPLLPRTTRFAAAYQATRHEGGGAAVEQVAFLPYGTEPLRCLYVALVVLEAGGGADALEVECDLRFPAVSHPAFTKEPDAPQKEKLIAIELREDGLVARTAPQPFHRDRHGNPLEVRVLRWPLPPVRAWTGQPGRARLWFRLPLGDPGRREWVFRLAFSPAGEEDARRALDRDPAAVFAATREAVARAVRPAQAYLPDEAIERGTHWAKVNMIRVQHRYPAGAGFTNDPPQDIVVVRDVAWYTFGCDWFMPEFSRDVHALVLEHGVEPSGKFTEYLRASRLPPLRDDYGLSLNDDTPLMILAALHHARATGDRAYLERTYPWLKRAAEAIMACERDGLIWVEAQGTNVWGIASWRNIIQGYRLTGAVTEIQAECAAALGQLAEAARLLGRPEDARRLGEAAERLRRALHERLADPVRGRYLLCRTADGGPAEEETADQVFPLLFSVADPDLAERVGERLRSQPYWAAHGCRTVPSDDPGYDPQFGWELMGGVWPNLTAWVAYATRRQDPGIVARALRAIWSVSECPRPRDHGSVCPGQFPERLDGEQPVSLGMALSPWMPPTYLWLVVEGLFGIEPTWDGTLRVVPALPPEWRWAALKGLPFRGRPVTLLLHEGEVHATAPVESPWPCERWERDLSELVAAGAGTRTLLLVREGEALVWVAAHRDGRVHLALPELGGDAPAELHLDLRAGEARLLRFRTG